MFKKKNVILLTFINISLVVSNPLQKFNLPEQLGNKEKRFEVTDRVWPESYGEASVCLWKDDKMGAISFTVDDNVVTQHDFWLRQMNKYGWKMTWFIIVQYLQDPNFVSNFFGKWDDFRRLINEGHDVASHTMTHGHCNDPVANANMSCPGILKNPPEPCCNIEYEYRESQKIIRDSLKGANCWTMAVSGHKTTDLEYYESSSGRTIKYDSYTHDFNLISKYYIAARGGGARPNIPNRTCYVNTNGGVIDTEWVNNIITLNPKQSAYWRGWLAPCWHYYPDTNEIAQQLAYVKSHEDDLWVDLYFNVARYGQSRDTHKLTVHQRTDSLITFTVTDSMVDSIYNFPLTVKIRLNNNWNNNSAAYQNGKKIGLKIVEYKQQKYALVDAVPDGGIVQLIISDKTGINSNMHGKKYAPLEIKMVKQNRFLKLYYAVSHNQSVNLSITNPAGRQLMVVNNLMLMKDNHEVVLPFFKTETGLMTLSVRTKGWTEHKKIILLE